MIDQNTEFLPNLLPKTVKPNPKFWKIKKKKKKIWQKKNWLFLVALKKKIGLTMMTLTLGPKTKAMVTVVLSWVRMNPKRYFVSGPTLGSRIKLNSKSMN